MNNILKFADFISIFPLFIIVISIFQILFFRDLELTGLLIIGIIIERILKTIKKDMHRPKGAKNCNIFSNEGLRPPKSPGFPSGHMITTTIFMGYILKNSESNVLKGFSILLVFLTGWARIYKGCHTLFQVISGFVFGLIISMVGEYIVKF
jgi:membrane-associated phospholipid phosphatase